MNYFTTSLMKNLFTNENNLPAFELAISELFRSELEKSINDILEYELIAFLDYEKYSRSDNYNSRNGSYQRKLDTKYGQLTLKIPRDRFGEFFSVMVPRYQRRDLSTEQTIIDLYDKGMTNNEIASIVKNLCGIHYSKQTISNITDKVIANVEALKTRPLSKEYAVIYADATCMGHSVQRSVHIAIGITPE